VRLRLVRGEESLIGFSDPIGKRPLGLLPRMAGAFVQRAAALMLASIALSVFTSIATVRYTTSGCTVSMPGLEVRGRIATEGRTPLQRDTRRRNGDQSTYHGEKLEPFQPKMQPSAWNSSYSLGCDSGNVSRAWTHVYKGETTSGKECGFRTFPEYTKCRMRKGNPKLFGHFADRLWVNQWRRNECCGARVPKISIFFAAAERERAKRCLQKFAAPSPGAVVKFNHKAGDVTGRV
jgi:hypothetical protein